MCGISGVIDLKQNRLFSNEIDILVNALVHRGRDAQGTLIDGNVALGHNRLSIIDLDARSNQPFLSMDKKCVIVFNGEIFNFRELRRLLKQKGVELRTNSDTEVLLELYRLYGEDCLPMLNGMFAFAIFDKKRNAVFIARDRLGIKPLYYMKVQEKFYFASEVKALTSISNYNSKLNSEALCEYIFMQSYFPGNTLFKDIHELQPGHSLNIDCLSGDLKKKQYWSYQWSLSQYSNYEMALAEAKELTKSAVESWGYANVPVGAYISGGLDSSTIASFISSSLPEANNGSLNTFSSVFSNSLIKDEREFSSIVARNINSTHHQVELPLNEIIDDHQNHLYVLDYPVGGYSAPYRTLSRYVRKHLKVVLTGHGGDELFCGYPKYIGALLCHLVDSARNNDGVRLPYLSFIEGFEPQIKQILSKSLFKSDREILYNMLDRTGYLWQYVNPDIRDSISNDYIHNKIEEMVGDSELSLLQKSLMLDRKLLLPALLHIEDRTSMIENLESRSPILDNNLVDFSAKLSQDLLLKNGLKSFMRDIGASVLPKPVVENKRKSGTMYPVSELFDSELKLCRDHYLHELDKSGLFTVPAKEILNSDKSLAQRSQWAMFSLGQWISTFNVGI